MISISPFEGHSLSMPRVQIAGQEPCAVSILARISNLPNCHCLKPLVWMLAEMYSANSLDACQFWLPYTNLGFLTFSLLPSIKSTPSVHIAFSSWYH
jgi:hypothetical protein